MINNVTTSSYLWKLLIALTMLLQMNLMTFCVQRQNFNVP